MDLNYCYVFFNTLDGHVYEDYPNGYYTICTKDLQFTEGIEVVSAPVYHLSFPIRLVYGIHNSERINKVLDLPLKRLWYPYYFKSKRGRKPFCFVILNRGISIDYLRWLKKYYLDCKIVLLHRDKKEVCLRVNPLLSDNPLLDLEMTIDKGESLQYGYPWFCEFESKANVPIYNDYPESDVFFAGRDKGRLKTLIQAYDVLTNAGLKVFFYLTGVNNHERIPKPGIVYGDKNMTYFEMLEHTINTRCVLEINQNNFDGYTSRFLESVIYGKRLITNNQTIKKTPFYKTGYIQVVENIKDIDPSFIDKQEDFVDYHYNGEFSPLRMIERVEEELYKKYGNPNITK